MPNLVDLALRAMLRPERYMACVCWVGHGT
jgi:hypothetical protein